MTCSPGRASAFVVGHAEQSITATTDAVKLTAAPIPGAWLIDGTPTTEAAEIARNRDGTTVVYLWRTSRARFRWHHESDETVVVVAGEAYVSHVTDGRVGPERRIGPGDVAFFPAGVFAEWRVPEHLRKVSTLTRPAPASVAIALRWVRRAKRQALKVFVGTQPGGTTRLEGKSAS